VVRRRISAHEITKHQHGVLLTYWWLIWTPEYVKIGCSGLSEGVSKSFQTSRLERELQMIQLSATRCSCIAILWVSLVSFAVITLCVASQRVFIVVSVYFVIDSVRKLLDTLSYMMTLKEWRRKQSYLRQMPEIWTREELDAYLTSRSYRDCILSRSPWDDTWGTLPWVPLRVCS
jgi:hypothetical protein